MEKLNNIDISLTSSLNGQTKEMVLHVQKSLNGINRDNIWPHLPKLGMEEASARAGDALTAKLKAVNHKNPFMSEWNEITAKEAAKRLGLGGKSVEKLIAGHGPVSKKLRDSQSAVSKEFEAQIRRGIKNDGKSEPVFMVSFETWLNRLINEERKLLSKVAPNIGKEEKALVIGDSLTALIKILDFAPNQNVPIQKILEFITDGRLGKEVNIVVIHCFASTNSPEEGIIISKTAEDFTIIETNGTRLVISQNDTLDDANRFANLLSQSKICHRVMFLMTDNDKFVMPGQENNVASFLESFANVLNRHEISKHDCSVIRASNVLDPKEFEQEWNSRHKKAVFSGKANTLTEKTVREEAERLQNKTLPSSFKTKEFATEIAKKAFCLQMAAGATIPILFEPAIILQKARGHQQATQIFRMGAKLAGEDPVILTHWKDRQKIE